MNGSPPQIIETCLACGQLLDVTDQNPFSEVICPSCNASQRVRKKFNNFELEELLGEGGMGSVFRARDLNLNRSVALKILKRGAASGEGDYKKLASEAKITASINHPHVVKVFSFGSDHSQFYLAMELVPKGSLDDLMGLQGRVGELQGLTVGIQIAQGLQAAFERGLLHRDVKPGNILFADANTSKIVDFGLAVLLDEQAQEQGEIWGTPYYIAPEKLDNRPEDFRSDIYSLGGTLFHAIAGRPPFEAMTASMVALKHIKSQAVSLQAFAPEVSSETAYVINRMLSKEPDDRYPSYDELIGHLSYARQKLIERAHAPIKKKDRGILESDNSKKVMGLVWGITLLALITAGILGFTFREKIFSSPSDEDSNAAPTTLKIMDLESIMASASNALINGSFADAATQFESVASATSVQPIRNWAIANQGLALLLDGNLTASTSLFGGLEKGGLYSTDPRDQGLANFFVELGRLMKLPKPIPPGTIRVYSAKNYEAFAMLAYGLKDWNLGDVSAGGEILEAFDKANPAPPHAWINNYKPLIQSYLLDYKSYRLLTKKITAADSSSKAAILTEIQKARSEATTGTKIDEAFAKLQDQAEAIR